MQRLEEVITGLWGMGRMGRGNVLHTSQCIAWKCRSAGSANAAGLWTLSSDGHLTHELQC